MTEVGIDKIGFFTPNFYLDMNDLAEDRNEDPNKYLIGIGQNKQSVIPSSQDAVAMAANAASKIIDETNRNKIDLIIFGTESGVDNSKSAAIYLQNLLNLNKNARAFEIKQACYGATAGLQMAKEYIKSHPDKKALVIGSDIARYGLKTAGEVTQGGGAIAMLISSNPNIMSISDDSAFHSEDIMDFWRPLKNNVALVDGHYSNDIYEQFFMKTIHDYSDKFNYDLNNLKAITFHLPYTKMGLKALHKILPEFSQTKQNELLTEFESSRVYNKEVGNLYTGSLYLSLLSLIDNSKNLKPGDQVGIFSYGSGAQGEFYIGTLKDGFKDLKRSNSNLKLIEERTRLNVDEYEKVFLDGDLPDGNFEITPNKKARFNFIGVKDLKRQYK
ncbi:hydroxymethylglutaryl-CoA synthase [Lactobacillus sp. S2-2]|uniref:hydroxymethylglutaryl-CoA synthase n=1 Tax=Lactobacillus sp. S2-2 TaxID=2692917 RepID=UPI001F01A610|nr:hydroxymethylglutaryl-CoA synthase [Lactobacillus sp. S2-2]MCF6514930.1 hydroxymethylglutaryl-CoA synthase [Lactobacillus sp. S2-2]